MKSRIGFLGLPHPRPEAVFVFLGQIVAAVQLGKKVSLDLDIQGDRPLGIELFVEVE